jgi:hypothetical protein
MNNKIGHNQISCEVPYILFDFKFRLFCFSRSNILRAVHQFCHYKVVDCDLTVSLKLNPQTISEETVELNFNWKSKARIGLSGSPDKALEYGGHKNTLDIALRYASRPTKDYRMPYESISQQS